MNRWLSFAWPPHQLHIMLAICIASVCMSSCQRASEADDRPSATSTPAKTYQHRDTANRVPQGPETLPPPTERQLRGLEGALELVEESDADLRYVAALTGLTMASSGRIPPQLATDLKAYNDTPRARLLLTMLDNSAWLFDEACGQPFDSVLAEGQAAKDLGVMARHVWTKCRLDRYSLLAGEAEFVESSKATGFEPMLAHFVYAYLELHGGAHPMEIDLLREAAKGIPPEARMPDHISDWLSAH